MTGLESLNDAELLAAYEAGIGLIGKAIAGMSKEQLLAKPIEGKWSTQQVVIHLCDAETAFSHRLKRIISEDGPRYSGWQENALIANGAYESQSAEDAVMIVDATRRQMTRVFKAVGPAFLDRIGHHNERGEQTGRVVLQYATWHLTHHLKFVADKKAKLGF